MEPIADNKKKETTASKTATASKPDEKKETKKENKQADDANPALWKQIAIPLLIIAVGLAVRFYFLE